MVWYSDMSCAVQVPGVAALAEAGMVNFPGLCSLLFQVTGKLQAGGDVWHFSEMQKRFFNTANTFQNQIQLQNCQISLVWFESWESAV